MPAAEMGNQRPGGDVRRITGIQDYRISRTVGAHHFIHRQFAANGFYLCVIQ
jgi:hypothetical protein